MFQMRAQDFGIRVGSLPKGPRNKITDVPGERCIRDSPWRAGSSTGASVSRT